MRMANFFEYGSPYLAHPLLTPERTALEVDFLLAGANLPVGARILDIGCGPGRHSIELASRGYPVVGIDPSPAMIAEARRRSAQAGVTPEFIEVAGEDFAAKEPFDAALCLFTTLGQIREQGDNRRLVKRVSLALRPGGIFAVEVPQRAFAVSNLKTEERFGAGERYTDVSRAYDPETNVVTEVFRVVSPRQTDEYVLRYRLFDWEELAGLLREAGFSITAEYGSYTGEPLESASPLMLLLARTPPFRDGEGRLRFS